MTAVAFVAIAAGLIFVVLLLVWAGIRALKPRMTFEALAAEAKIHAMYEAERAKVVEPKKPKDMSNDELEKSVNDRTPLDQ